MNENRTAQLKFCEMMTAISFKQGADMSMIASSNGNSTASVSKYSIASDYLSRTMTWPVQYAVLHVP
ncbi:hypothetical protein M8J76_002518 [Diaphorina citri]|nr:hypothetical protein M8J76_002518 [Diaphorina citri]KAI5750869.1 hypothetical protein M8J77_001989 [Diaphorina citri]